MEVPPHAKRALTARSTTWSPSAPGNMTTAVGEDAQPVGEYAAAAAAAGMSPEEYEKLMNEPQMRQLMHHIQHGSESFKIERGGEGPAQPIQNIVVPHGASQEEIGAALLSGRAMTMPATQV